MFSIQQLFSKGDRFQELLEAASQEAHESVRLAIELMKPPQKTQNLDDLILARRKEKRISEQISTELVRTYEIFPRYRLCERTQRSLRYSVLSHTCRQPPGEIRVTWACSPGN